MNREPKILEISNFKNVDHFILTADKMYETLRRGRRIYMILVFLENLKMYITSETRAKILQNFRNEGWKNELYRVKHF